jgi:hypothetical protein
MPHIEPHKRLPKLPSTLEDAISFVKSVGQKYLWIDAVRAPL